MAIAVLLEQAMAEGLEVVLPAVTQEEQAVMVELHQLEAEVVVHLNQALVAQAEQAAKARCEYGPGSSEQRRTKRPGCAEA